jgi:nicotinamidase-related amidase
MLRSADVPLAQSALLVIDVQDSFKVGARWDRRSNPQFEDNVAALIASYRAARLPVYFILHTDGDDGFARTSPHFKLMDFISLRSDEPVIVKDTRNCFTSTNLQSLLLHQGVRRLAITGIQTEQCCETTARVAADLGYAVDFVLDGTLTFPIPSNDGTGKELGVEAIHERTVYVLRDRFARIVSAGQLQAEIAATL